VNHLPAQDADASLLMSTIRLSDLTGRHFDMDCEHFDFLHPGITIKSGIISIFCPEIHVVIVRGIDRDMGTGA
jgi:hypothetical protein